MNHYHSWSCDQDPVQHFTNYVVIQDMNPSTKYFTQDMNLYSQYFTQGMSPYPEYFLACSRDMHTNLWDFGLSKSCSEFCGPSSRVTVYRRKYTQRPAPCAKRFVQKWISEDEALKSGKERELSVRLVYDQAVEEGITTQEREYGYAVYF